MFITTDRQITDRCRRRVRREARRSDRNSRFYG